VPESILRISREQKEGYEMELIKRTEEEAQRRQVMMLDDKPGVLLEEAKPFVNLMMQYKCAIMEVETKLKVLDAEFSQEYNRNPFESIKTRLKTPLSIYEKLKKKGYPVTVDNIEKHLSDVAGVRVICSFPDDIYRLAELLSRQDDIEVVKRKDYIKNPKPNGYRSLHLILRTPIFFSREKKFMQVEVQFRTIAMDFWASLEHKLKYKKNVEDGEAIARELKNCSDFIEALDYQMQGIRDRIDNAQASREEEDQML